jgi:hypothetical protein
MKAVHEATAISAQIISNAEGYAFRDPPRNLLLTASAQAFKTVVQTGVVLQVNQAARLDVTLSLGATTEQITVRAFDYKGGRFSDA